MTDKENTMRIWDAVSKTDVDHTKEVSFGRKFTAIDAHYQIMEATRQFGPVGDGWGYNNQYGETHLQDGRVIAWCDVTLWWGKRGEWEGMPTPLKANHYGPVRGAAMLISTNKDGSLKAPDHDAYKKASTDGLTKCLSHLGFNADVFLGQFDDNKYVQELRAAKQNEASAKDQAYQQDRKKFIDAIKAAKTPDAMDAVAKNYDLWMAGLPVSTATEMRSWVMKQKAGLSKPKEEK